MTAGSTYTPIATTTLGSNQSSVTFNSLGSYTDLILVAKLTTTTVNDGLKLTFNGDTTSGLYSMTWMVGYGNSVTQSSRMTSKNFIQIGTTTGFSTSSPGTLIINLMNYSNSSDNKTVLYRLSNPVVGTGDGEITATTGLWRNSNAITSLTLTSGLIGGSLISSGSTFTIYGIVAA